MSKRDIIFILILLAIALLFYFFAYKNIQNDGDIVKVTVNGELYDTYPLSEDREVDIVISGEVKNSFEIKDNAVHMCDADCPDKLCIKQGQISRDGQMIVCLPNKVVIEIESEEEDYVDSISK
ncbi:MAG: NusG domain II-containing protein [Lachnospiraceae bacterium]|nr:NusG domain II-containing protein [Lachnospiraceae bacterium]